MNHRDIMGIHAKNAYETARFWATLDDLVADARYETDRPKGSTHPRFPEYVYPVDYGFLTGTQGGDGEGIDVWHGTHRPATVTGVVCTIDPFKRNAELKILLGCTPDEVAAIRAFYADQPQATLFHSRPSKT